jgi:hypothetical protein
MNPQNRADQVFESWLVDGPTRMPEHLVDSIVTQLEQTHQRKHSWLPGREQMNRMMVAVGGVAALALLAVVGLNFFGHGSGVGVQPTPTATPVATLSPTATPVPTLSPTATPAPSLLKAGVVNAGRYFTDVGGYRYTFTAPGDDWLDGIDGVNDLLTKGNNNGTSNFAAMWLWGPSDPTQVVWTQPCQWSGTGVTPGPTVNDLATAIAGLQGFETTQPTSVTVSGYAGEELQLTVPSGTILVAGQAQGCYQGQYVSWDGRYYQTAGETDDVRILDLNGARTLVITVQFPGTDAQTLTEQSQMFDALEIAPAPASPSPTP